MASTASDALPSSLAAPASAFLHDDHPLFLDPAAASSSLFPATTVQETAPPPHPSAAARKPPRKRPRPSRRQPTTVLATDVSNFRAMVHEFTGIPAPPPFAPHLGPGGELFGAAGTPSGSAAAPFQLLLRPSPLKLTAAPHASPPTCTTSSSSLPPSSRSGAYGGFDPILSGAVPRYDGGFDAADEGERQGHGHGFLSFLHTGERYHGH